MCTIHSDTLFTSCNGNNPSLVQFTLLLNGNQFPMCLPEGPPYTPPECPPPADECNCQCKSVSGNELTYSLKFRPTERHDGGKIWCTVDCLGGNPSIGPGCDVSVGKWTLLHIFQTASFLAAPNQIWSESYRYEEAWNQLPQTVRHTPLSSSTHSNPPPQTVFSWFLRFLQPAFFPLSFFRVLPLMLAMPHGKPSQTPNGPTSLPNALKPHVISVITFIWPILPLPERWQCCVRSRRILTSEYPLGQCNTLAIAAVPIVREVTRPTVHPLPPVLS